MCQGKPDKSSLLFSTFPISILRWKHWYLLLYYKWNFLEWLVLLCHWIQLDAYLYHHGRAKNSWRHFFLFGYFATTTTKLDLNTKCYEAASRRNRKLGKAKNCDKSLHFVCRKKIFCAKLLFFMETVEQFWYCN